MGLCSMAAILTGYHFLKGQEIDRVIKPASMPWSSSHPKLHKTWRFTKAAGTILLILMHIDIFMRLGYTSYAVHYFLGIDSPSLIH